MLLEEVDIFIQLNCNLITQYSSKQSSPVYIVHRRACEAGCDEFCFPVFKENMNST